jgi:hypothetical protein
MVENAGNDKHPGWKYDVALEGNNALSALGGLRARHRQQPSQPLQPTPLTRFHKLAGAAKTLSALT